MHELALTRPIFRIADRVVVGRAISTIYLDVGVLRRVAPDALDFVWEYMSRQSENLARSKPRINLVSVVIVCEECGADTPTDDNLISACAAYNFMCYHMKTREKFILTEMDVS